MRQPVIFDGRNIYNPQRMREAGFTYYSIGRPAVKPKQIVNGRGIKPRKTHESRDHWSR